MVEPRQRLGVALAEFAGVHTRRLQILLAQERTVGSL